MSIFIRIFVVDAERRMCFETECIMAVQGHPRSLILAPIEIASATSYWSSIVILVLPCPVSEILQVFCWEERPHPYCTQSLAIQSKGELQSKGEQPVFHLDISWGGISPPPEMTISPPPETPGKFFFNFINKLQAYELNRTVRSDFCLQISVVL